MRAVELVAPCLAVMALGCAPASCGPGPAPVGRKFFGSVSSPKPVRWVKPRTSIVVSDSHACLVTPLGELWCWGGNAFGALGVPGAPRRPVRVPTDRPVVAAAAGGARTCVCDAAGELECWGRLSDSGPGERRSYPIARCRAVSTGRAHVCAVSEDGAVRCWGHAWATRPRRGSVVGPRPTPGWHDAPRRIRGLPAVAAVGSGDAHACARSADGRAFCWGDDNAGQLSSGARAGDTTLVPLGEVTAVASGWLHSCALVQARAWCWGLEPGCTLPRVSCASGLDLHGLFRHCAADAPWAVAAAPDAIAIGVGWLEACVLSTGGDLRCWDLRRPVEEPPALRARGVAEFAMQGRSGCVLERSGALRCWGRVVGAQDGDTGLAAPVLELHGSTVVVAQDAAPAGGP